MDPVTRDAEANGTNRRTGLRLRDGLMLLAVAAWAALILANFDTPPPTPPTPPAVPYAVIAHHLPGPH